MAEPDKQESDKRLAIVKLYLKDLSFESPQAPEVFRGKEWAPQTNLNLRSSHNAMGDNMHEIVLTVTVDAKEKDTDKTIFLIELQQAGIFEIAGYSNEEMSALVGSMCPGILFPYARETVASIVQKGGFPEFILQPINFDALYLQSLQQRQESAEGNGSQPTTTETH